MPNNVVINNIDHKDIKVDTRYSSDYGHNHGRSLVFPTEFNQIQCEYPILFVQDPKNQQFQSVALVGLEEDENLFLKSGNWHATYVPHMINKGPFSIGLQDQVVDGQEQRKPVVMLDTDDKRVNTENGQALFLEFGGNSPYLERIQSTLVSINDGIDISKPMFAAFSELNLLEPVTLKLDVNADKSFQLEGYFTINAENLAKLSGSDLQDLHQAGFLQLAHAVIASLNNMQKLVKMKQAQLK